MANCQMQGPQQETKSRMSHHVLQVMTGRVQCILTPRVLAIGGVPPVPWLLALWRTIVVHADCDP